MNGSTARILTSKVDPRTVRANPGNGSGPTSVIELLGVLYPCAAVLLAAVSHASEAEIVVNPLSHHDALKHHFKSLKTDLISYN